MKLLAFYSLISERLKNTLESREDRLVACQKDVRRVRFWAWERSVLPLCIERPCDFDNGLRETFLKINSPSRNIPCCGIADRGAEGQGAGARISIQLVLT